jgi:hypothetical protein
LVFTNLFHMWNSVLTITGIAVQFLGKLFSSA